MGHHLCTGLLLPSSLLVHRNLVRRRVEGDGESGLQKVGEGSHFESGSFPFGVRWGVALRTVGMEGCVGKGALRLLCPEGGVKSERE